jgi:hypothetical protein
MPLPPPKSRKHRTKAEAREASNGALVPYRYQPGQSGNAAGFPRSRREQIEACERLARERSPEAIETMTELMRNSEDDRVRLLAADKLNERGLGRSREFASNEVGASAWHDMSADELRAKLIGMVEDISKIEVPAGFVCTEEDLERHRVVRAALVMAFNGMGVSDDGQLVDYDAFRRSAEIKRARWNRNCTIK